MDSDPACSGICPECNIGGCPDENKHYFTLPASVFLSAIDSLDELERENDLIPRHKHIIRKNINLLMHGVFEEEVENG